MWRRPEDNNWLTRWALLLSLQESVRSNLAESEYIIPELGFLDEIALVMDRHPEGHEQLAIQPYFLRESNQLGCLVDFHFRKRDGVPFSRRVQQLSLSLDKQFRRNLDCYIDRFEKIRGFVNRREAVFAGLQLPGTSSVISLSREFASLPGRRLRSKSYIFGNGRESRSQFTGLRDFGPLQRLAAPPRLLFLFREQDRRPRESWRWR